MNDGAEAWLLAHTILRLSTQEQANAIADVFSQAEKSGTAARNAREVLKAVLVKLNYQPSEEASEVFLEVYDPLIMNNMHREWSRAVNLAFIGLIQETLEQQHSAAPKVRMDWIS